LALGSVLRFAGKRRCVYFERWDHSWYVSILPRVAIDDTDWLFDSGELVFERRSDSAI